MILIVTFSLPSLFLTDTEAVREYMDLVDSTYGSPKPSIDAAAPGDMIDKRNESAGNPSPSRFVSLTYLCSGGVVIIWGACR